MRRTILLALLALLVAAASVSGAGCKGARVVKGAVSPSTAERIRESIGCPIQCTIVSMAGGMQFCDCSAPLNWRARRLKIAPIDGQRLKTGRKLLCGG